MLLNSQSSCEQPGLFAGLSTVDMTYVVEDMPRRNEKLSAPFQLVTVGGPATNAAITFSFLGGHSVLVTAVGRHPVSAVIRQDLSRFSVSLHDAANERDDPPPVSSIFVIQTTGERTVVSANANAFPGLQPAPDPQWLDSALFALVDGHYMPLCIGVAERARADAIPVVMDGGSWKPGMERLLPYVDVAVCSNDFRPPGCRDDSDVFEFLMSRGIVQIALTRGALPVLYSDHGTTGAIEVEQIQAIDTLGAGDIFHGAFCYSAYESGTGFVEALAFAARVSTFSCLHKGTRRWMQVFPGLEAFRR